MSEVSIRRKRPRDEQQETYECKKCKKSRNVVDYRFKRNGNRNISCNFCLDRFRCRHGLSQKSKCKKCSGTSICKHLLRSSECRQCYENLLQINPSLRGRIGIFCWHGRRKHHCKECGGKGICQHNHQKYYCKECGGKGVCEHGRRRYRCEECKNKMEEV